MPGSRMLPEGWLSGEESDLLTRLAAGVRAGCIVEVGSYRGRSTVALAEGAGDRPVFAIEPHEVARGVLGGSFGPEDRRAFYENMLAFGAWDVVRLVNLPSVVAAAGWHLPVGLLWIDGDHRYEAVAADVEAWTPHLTDDATIVLDDVLDPSLGPHLVAETLVARGWQRLDAVGKVASFSRR